VIAAGSSSGRAPSADLVLSEGLEFSCPFDEVVTSRCRYPLREGEYARQLEEIGVEAIVPRERCTED